jgi:hypothetical protein
VPRTGTYDLDAFAYANGDLEAVSGGDWQHDPFNFGSGNVNVLSNQIRDNSGFSMALYNLAGPKTQASVDYIEVALKIATLPAKGGGEKVALEVMQTPTPTAPSNDTVAYEFHVDFQSGTHKSLIVRDDNPAFPTLVETTASDWAADDLIIGRLHDDGTLQLIRDRAGTETVLLSTTDTTYTGDFYGGVYLTGGAGTARYDDFSYGTFTGAGGGTPIDGGLAYYGTFSNSWPSTADFWPIGVWLQNTATTAAVDDDIELGINTYFAVSAPEDSSPNLDYAEAAGLYCILQQGELNRFTLPTPSPHVSYGLSDELDMTYTPGEDAYLGLQAEKATLPADGRFIYANFGKGCLFWQADVDAEKHPAEVDVLSSDAYYFSDLDCAFESQGGKLRGITGRNLTTAEAEHPYMYGLNVQRMRFLVDYAKPVLGFVEVAYAGTNAHRAPTPDQVVAALWHMVIAGARGVILFVHSFGGPPEQHTEDALDLATYATTRAACAATFATMTDLAPVLNGNFTDEADYSLTGDVVACVKQGPDSEYLFIGATGAGGAFSFTKADLGNRTITEVLSSTTETVTTGSFSGTMSDANDVRVYNLAEVEPGEPGVGGKKSLLLGIG